ncbi:ferritin-like domain-containing protein [Paenibacillus sp. GCM10027626]|uniref:ferritin-like domain-containing protein n=1 Tax=Paenibacillus sp. GCM10027626 TaxID=3273411 RepID=UPI00363E2D05
MSTTMTNQTVATAPIPMPPRAISTKDFEYLKDALSWELLAFKKFAFYAQQATDANIKAALNKAGQMHQRHFQKLLTHLQVNNNAAMASLPKMPQNQPAVH